MKYKMGDIVERVHGNVDRFTTDLKYYVAGEQFESRELLITRKGLLTPETVNLLGFKFHFPFKSGDVLFMARSPHLRKAGMVTFDGICSDASYILRSKDESILLQRFLPFIVQSDLMWDYFNAHKTGSVNPLLNWKEFCRFEIELPTIEEQERFATLLWAIERARTSYKNLLTQMDELVKSQFVEMSRTWKGLREPLSSFISTITYGFTNPMTDTEEGPWKVTAKDVGNGRIDYSTARRTSQEEYDMLTDKSKPHIGDILLTKDGTLGRVALVTQDNICINQSVALIRCNERVLPEFLTSILQMPEYQEEMLANAGGVTVKHLYITRVDKMMMLIPSVLDQQAWLTFVGQTDKSKLAIQQALDSLEKSRNAIMKKVFG